MNFLMKTITTLLTGITYVLNECEKFQIYFPKLFSWLGFVGVECVIIYTEIIILLFRNYSF